MPRLLMRGNLSLACVSPDEPTPMEHGATVKMEQQHEPKRQHEPRGYPVCQSPSRYAGSARLFPFMAIACAVLLIAGCGSASAHGIGGQDAAFVAATRGPDLIPFLYLGAKHMVTGYDHLLFIFGVIFFLYRLSHVALYVTMFSVGHSITLLAGVLGGLHVNPYLVDAVIGLSVVYKAFDNLGGFQAVFGVQPNSK